MKKTKKNSNTKSSVTKKNKQCVYSGIALNSFENKYEKELKKKGLETKDIEHQLIKLFKTPFSPKTIKPENDYYSYINYSWLEEKSKELKIKKNIMYR